MPINITDELHAATTKGKIASAKEVFLTGDTENLQQIGEKTHQLEDSIKNIAATGGASTAAAVTFDNAASGMTAVNAQSAIEELSNKNKLQDTELSKKAYTADVTSQMQAIHEKVNAIGKVVEVEQYITASVDKENKVVEFRRLDGEKHETQNQVFHKNVTVLGNIDAKSIRDVTAAMEKKVDKENRKSLVDIDFSNSLSTINNKDWVDVKTDNNNKIIEGITDKGEKFIAKFHPNTLSYIKESIGNTSNPIKIPIINTMTEFPIPCIVNGSSYRFMIKNLSKKAFNIRVKFRFNENLLNQGKSCVIVKLGNKNAITANAVALTQVKETYIINNIRKDSYYPVFNGGISLNGSSTDVYYSNQNLGLFAFYVKYVGSSKDVTIANNGIAIVINIDSVITTLPFSVYPTCSELYEALKNITDIEVGYNELEGRNTNELAVFPATKLVSQYYTGLNGEKSDEKVEYYDTAPLFIPYAINEKWHQAEIVCINGNIYSSCDGKVINIIDIEGSELTLGYDCNVLFKDLEIYQNSCYDAEYINGLIISSANPYIIVHEGHNIIKTPTYEETSTINNIGTTVDRLQHVYTKMIAKGYTPVSIDDIADYYAGNKMLPKRCFTSIFDDYRWVNCLDIDNRAVFTRLGIKPALAIITSYDSDIIHNGKSITPQVAANICKSYHFHLVSHSKKHRYGNNVKPSTYMEQLKADIYDGDIVGIDNSIFVYPFGQTNAYWIVTLQWLGFRLGINIVRNEIDNNLRYTNRYNLTRKELGLRVSLDNINNTII